MKEENTLMKKIGQEQSFKVPEGYFENLTSEVMNKLPEKEKASMKEVSITTWQRLKPMFYMAAMFVGAALIIRVASSGNRSMTNEVAAAPAETEVVSDQLINSALETMMLDDYSLYVYLSDANTENAK